MKKHPQKSQGDYILDILINKYRADPDRFLSYLPELTQEIEGKLPSISKKSHTSTLTEIERERLCKLLLEVPKDKSVTEKQAIQALEYCATLIQDESLPDEIDRKTLLRFAHSVVGTPISKIKKATEITVGDGEATKTIAILRGVYLRLTWNDLLVAISISPTKSKERSEALRFVGIGKDASPDISLQHNFHFSEGTRCRFPRE